MYTEAFLFVGNLLQDGLIKKIKFRKNTFKVIWKNDSQARYDYNQHGVIEFLEDLEELKK